MILKRYVPIAIVFLVGFITLISWFIPHEPFGHLEIHTTQWYDIIASFAMILGALNLLKLQGKKVVNRKKGWIYSLAAILGFFLTLTMGFLIKGGNYVVMQDIGENRSAVFSIIGEEMNITPAAAELMFGALNGEIKTIQKNFYTKKSVKVMADRLRDAGATVECRELAWGSHLQAQGTYFSWIFHYIFTPLSATMFALLAFFVASASYRAFRIRNLEATILLGAGILLMMGRVPLGSVGWLEYLHLSEIQEWIYQYPNAAGARAIMMGIGLGVVGTSLRVILGIEKSFMGEK
jgi:hypothetical protein